MSVYTTPTRANALGDLIKHPFVTGAYAPGVPRAALDTDEESSRTNAINEDTFSFWEGEPSTKTNTLNEIRWVYSLNTASRITAMLINGHNFADIASASGRLIVESSASHNRLSRTGWTQYHSIDVASNDPIAVRFSGANHTNWQIRLTGCTGNARASNIWVGNELILQRMIYGGYTPSIADTNVDLLTIPSGYDHVEARATPKGNQMSATISNVDEEWVREQAWIDWQERWNGGHPSFWVWRPPYGEVSYMIRQGAAIAPQRADIIGYTTLEINGRIL